MKNGMKHLQPYIFYEITLAQVLLVNRHNDQDLPTLQ